ARSLSEADPDTNIPVQNPVETPRERARLFFFKMIENRSWGTHLREKMGFNTQSDGPFLAG
ncbi:MAG: hypothetical protein ACREMY_30335, partial [bacterium]